MTPLTYPSSAIDEYKFGTEVVTFNDAARNGQLDVDHLEHLLDQICYVRNTTGRRAAVVLSGACALGRALEGQEKTQNEPSALTASYFTVGQGPLFETCRATLEKRGIRAHQILPIPSNFETQEQCEHFRATMAYIFARGGLPIFNTNDVFDFSELQGVKSFKDNDRLAGKVGEVLKVDTCGLFSTVDGLYRNVHDPKTLIPQVNPWKDKYYSQYIARDGTCKGQGGMDSKFDVAVDLARRGTHSYIANGRIEDVIVRIRINRERLGTHFDGRQDPNDSDA